MYGRKFLRRRRICTFNIFEQCKYAYDYLWYYGRYVTIFFDRRSSYFSILYISVIVLSGIGFGLIYLPAVVCVGYYFETKRSLATGIAVCGSGFGTFAFAPLATLLLEEYSWKGANLILAGLILKCAVSKWCESTHSLLLAVSFIQGVTESFRLIERRHLVYI